MKTTISEIIKIERALSLIKPDHLSGKPIYAIAKNLNHLAPITAAYNQKRDSIIKEISGGTNQILNTDTEKVSRFTSEIEKELQVEIEVEIHRFTLKESELTGVNPSDLAQLIKSEIVDVVFE